MGSRRPSRVDAIPGGGGDGQGGQGGMRVLSVRVTAVEQRPGSLESPPGIPVDQSLSMLSRHVTDARLGRVDAKVAARWSEEQEAVRRAVEEEVQRKVEEEARRVAEQSRLRLEAQSLALAEIASREAEARAKIEAEERLRCEAEDSRRREAEAVIARAEQLKLRAEQEAKRQADEAQAKLDREIRRRVDEEVRRKTDEEAKRQAEEEAKFQAERESQRRLDEEAKRIADEEAKRIADEEAKLKADEETKRIADEQAKRKADEEAKRIADQDAKRKADEEAKRIADEDARRKADEEAKRIADQDAKRRADEEAKRIADEQAKRKADEEAKRRADEEAKRIADEEAKRKADEEAKRLADQEAKRKADEEAKRIADQEAMRLAQESLRRLAEEARQQTEELQRRAQAEARKREEMTRLAQEENRRKTTELAGRQLMTTPGQVLMSRAVPHPQPGPDTTDLDRSFNELFESGAPTASLRPRSNPDPSRTIEILSPIIQSPAPPFQKLLALPLAVPRPSASQAARYRSAPPEFRPSLPVLPLRLQHLVEASIVPSAFHAAHQTRRSMPSWMVTGLVAFLMGVSGIAIVNYALTPKNGGALPTQQAAPKPAPVAAVTQSPEPAANAVVSKRLVELTGFRVRVDRSGKTSVQYVVINHSDGDMRGLTAHVVLRSATAKPFQAPVANFTVRLPAMAAMESKDLTTLVETPVDRGVPDWTDLRADVRIEQ